MSESPDKWEALKAVVADALELAPDQREALLAERCAGDAGALREARALVGAYEGADGVIDRRADAWLGLDGPDLLALGGQRVGRYRLERLLAEGAMAAVYLARQANPDRAVALKLVRAGLPLVDAGGRFKRETSALGRLRHPNIAQIYEAGVHRAVGGAPGTSGAALPYIAMEFVDGPPITAYARDRHLSRRERVRLMAKVARAVHAAHQQAVIHRDLKPANVLVDVVTGEPKVLDFGIARIADLDDAEAGAGATWQTTAGVLLGTPGYMSPEQAAGRPGEVDVRSDVWALGVMLYELLTDRLPVDVRDTTIAEALKRIEQADPPPIGRVRPVERGGDLETVVAVALDREKDRRYPSAQALADDLDRVLAYEPISARPPSRLYRAAKFVRRHRFGVAVTAAFATLLAASAVTSAVLFVGAARARDRAEKLNTFLLELVSRTDPNVGRRDITLSEALEDGDRLIVRNFAGDVAGEAEVRSTIGWAFYNLGKYDQAVAQLRRAVELREASGGADSPATFDTITRLATAIRWQYRPAEALAVVEPAYQRASAVLGAEHPSTLGLLDNYAGALDDLGRNAEAEPLYRRAVELNRKVMGPDDQQTLSAMNNLAVVLVNQGRHAEAEPVLREVVERRSAGDTSRRVAAVSNRHNLAGVLASLGRLDEALREFDRVIADATELLGPDHSRTLSARVSHADALLQAGRAAEALGIQQDVLDRRRRLLGDAHEQTLTSHHNLINALLANERYADAETEGRALLALAEAHAPPEHLIRIVARWDLAAALSGLERYAESEPLLREVVARLEEKFGADNPRTLQQRANLAAAVAGLGRHAEAREILEPMRSAMERNAAPAVRLSYHRNLARVLMRLEAYGPAESELLAAQALARRLAAGGGGGGKAAEEIASMLAEVQARRPPG